MKERFLEKEAGIAINLNRKLKKTVTEPPAAEVKKHVIAAYGSTAATGHGNTFTVIRTSGN